MLYDTQNPAHAYLFCGAQQALLTTHAYEFIYSTLLADGYGGDSELLYERIKDNAYSDVMLIDNEEESVKIDEMRRVQTFMELKPIEGTAKFAVIKNADKMTDQAQNAMLKTLEEAIPNRYILLLASVSDSLLPTVLSRLQTVRFSEDASLSLPEASVRENLANMLEEMLLAGNTDVLFSLSDYITKDKNQTVAFLYCLYWLFGQIISYNQKVIKQVQPQLRLLCENISLRCAERSEEYIKQTIAQIKRNASPLAAVDAMLINIREEYNAENSRGQI